MTAKNEQTAEQKLLKMIETSSTPQIAGSQSQQGHLKKQDILVFVKIFNQVLVVGVVVSALFFANEIRLGMMMLNRNVQFVAHSQMNKQSLALGVENLIPTIQSVSFYLAGVKQRNIFQPVDLDKTKSAVQSSPVIGGQLAQQTQHMRLVGVSWLNSADSASVMIEDTDKKLTYFLKRGEKIGDIMVKNIYADSAVLGYENEEMVIKYDKTQM